MSGSRFPNKEQLTPRQVYAAIVGICELNHFNLKQVMHSGPDEIARVYEHAGQVYLIYYPGTDSQKLAQTPKPLAVIVEEANMQLDPEHDPKSMNRLFVLAESNQVKHYIQGMLIPGQNGVVLTTDDSISRQYDESYIDRMFAGEFTARQRFQRGWQKPMRGQVWQCGHYVIAAMERLLLGQDIGIYAIKPDIKKCYQNHLRYFNAGIQSIDEHQKLESDVDLLSDDSVLDALGGDDASVALVRPVFFARHRILRDSLIGFGVGAVAAGATIGGLFAADAGSYFLDTAATVGGFIFAEEVAAVAVGVTAMVAATVGCTTGTAAATGAIVRHINNRGRSTSQIQGSLGLQYDEETHEHKKVKEVAVTTSQRSYSRDSVETDPLLLQKSPAAKRRPK